MDPALKTMIENLETNSGKKLDQWIAIVNKSKLEKHGEIVKMLKEDHGLGHGYANMITHLAKDSSSVTNEDKDGLVDSHYKGKEHYRPLYDTLLAGIQKFGKDIEIAPKNNYVSLRRKKQFATLTPASKTRFEIGINLKGTEPKGMLEACKPNSMCSHKINLASDKDLNKEVWDWLKKAYEGAG